MNSVAITATGSYPLKKKPWENQTILSNSGNYTGLTFTVQASVDGTNYANIGVIDKSSGKFIAGGTAISPTNATGNSWQFDSSGYQDIQVVVSAISTNTVTFAQQSIISPASPSVEASSTVGATPLPDYKYATGTTTTTFTAAEFTGGKLTVYNSTATTPGSIATPTAAAMFAAQPSAAIGQTWVVRVINSSGSANTMTITADASVTLSGTTTYTIAEFAYRDFLLTFTSATTATMVAIGGGAAATN